MMMMMMMMMMLMLLLLLLLLLLLQLMIGERFFSFAIWEIFPKTAAPLPASVQRTQSLDMRGVLRHSPDMEVLIVVSSILSHTHIIIYNSIFQYVCVHSTHVYFHTHIHGNSAC